MTGNLKIALLCSMLVLGLTTTATADEFYATHLVLRFFAEDSAAQRASLRDAHHDYLAGNGREMATFRLLDDNAKLVGEGGWVAFESEAEARAFVDGDPYQQAGLYRDVSIRKTDLYMLDKWFSITPAWREGPALEQAHQAYDEKVQRIQREE
jgi:uncharacterized protein YciI